jgi:hypothetical protein
MNTNIYLAATHAKELGIETSSTEVCFGQIEKYVKWYKSHE